MTHQPIRPIRSDADLDEALLRIENLMNATEGPELDELEVLSELVHSYETKNHPIGPPSPIGALKFRMEQMALTRRDLEPYIGSSGKVSEVLSGKQPLTLKMIRALHRGLGIPADILLGDPAAHLEDDDIAADYERFPLAEMAKRGYFNGSGIQRGKEKCEEALRWLVSQAGKNPRQVVAHCRKNDEARQNAKMDFYALQAWCLRALADAGARRLPAKYEEGSITSEFMRQIATLSALRNGVKTAVQMLAQIGVHLVYLPHLPHTYVDGAAMLLPDGTPVIAVTVRYDRVDNFWHVLLHELAHVKNDLVGGCDLVYDDFSLPSAGSQSEIRADREAKEALVPPVLFRGHDLERMSVDTLSAIARRARVHPAVVAGQIRHETGNYRRFARIIGQEEVRIQFES